MNRIEPHHPVSRVDAVITGLLGPIYRMAGRAGADRLPTQSEIRSVLVIRPDEIGDVVLTGPFLRRLREALPQARIDLVVKSGVRNLVERCPYVDRVFEYDWSGEGLWHRIARRWRALRLVLGELGWGRYDLALLPRWDADHYGAILLAYFSGARWRIGFTEHSTEDKARINAGSDRMLTHVVSDDQFRHEAQRPLGLLAFLGMEHATSPVESWWDSGDAAQADAVLATREHRAGILHIALAPGARVRDKIWPVERYAAVLRLLAGGRPIEVIVIGGEQDRPLGDILKDSGLSVVNAAGRLTLRETWALLSRCDLYLGNDTGPAHLAAAAGIPAVVISSFPRSGRPEHPRSPERFRPWMVSHRVLQPPSCTPPCDKACSADHPHCILGVSPPEVLQAIHELLGSTGR